MSSSQQPAGDTDARTRLLQRWLADRRGPGDGPAIPAADRSRPLRTSSGQRRLWFQDQAEEVTGDRNIPFAWRLTGELDVPALFGALDLLVRRHEALRTAFHEDGSDLLQTVGEPYVFDRTVTDAAGSGEGDAGTLIEAAAYEPFDWTEGRLLRARLFRLASDEHVLLLVVPHLVMDDWSADVLLGELTAGYAALHEGTDPKLPELRVQYPDFAAWQRTRLDNGALQPGIDHWLRALDGAPTVLDLPTDRPRPALSSHRAGWTPLRLDAATVRAVEELSAREKATPFMTLLAAYCVLLSRRSGRHDLVIGSPVAGRALSELEPLIGFFVNTLPLRVRTDPQRSFGDLLGQVRETVLSAMEHQDVPFDHLVQLLAPERSTAANPLVQVAFSLNNSAAPGRRLPGLAMEPHQVTGRSSRYDLVLAVAPEGDELHGELVYDSDLFDAETARQLAADYLATLTALVAEPDTPMARLTGHTPHEAVLDGPTVTYDTDLNVAALVAEAARRTPDRLAVRAPDGDYGFGELDRRANALAAALREHGAGPERSVGVHLGRSRHLVTALLAVWKTGAAFVPLDPTHPEDRLSGIVRDADVSVLIADAASPLAGEYLPVIDPASPALADHTEARPAGHLPDALAYIIYTSGTTGEPKGVGITYRNVANLVTAVAGLTPPEEGLGANVLAPAFDGWLWSTLLPLAHGRGVVLADPLDDADGVFDGRADLVTTTPSLLAAHPKPAEGTGPKTVIVAGEACPKALVDGWSGGRRFINAYGPTETTICATWADSQAGDDPVTIGRPLPNYRIRVLDRYLQPVPAGTPGELFIAGEGVGRGYRNLPGQTAARFLPDPYGGGRMYRTGDLVRVRADRTVEFVGRADQQIKVRGFRVEPAGIERRAAAVPGVRSAAVFTVPDPLAPTLGLALVPDETAGDDLQAQVRTVLKAELPDFMVPTHLVRVDRLPLTPTGKVDETALAQLVEESTDDEAESGAAPATPSERLVADIWSKVLERPVRTVDDNFFELGGHSLVATQMVSLLRKETGLRLRMRLLYAQPTVGALATELDRLAAEAAQA
ncbi:amino acid adenylation domain-containing protein [Streptomyces sp. NPDC042319]|uniref:non-ribosomal peptide synthetase n=1 Tax=Streptomyces sp. NPDC042319 TaxID=3154332 RepID=UPI0033F16C76